MSGPVFYSCVSPFLQEMLLNYKNYREQISRARRKREDVKAGKGVKAEDSKE